MQRSSIDSAVRTVSPVDDRGEKGRGRSQAADAAPCTPFSRLCLQEADSSVSQARTAPISRLYLSLDVLESAEVRMCRVT